MLKLYLHPLSSFCHKALIAFYETGAAFEPVIVNLGDEHSRADFIKVWPIGKFPVLRDESRQLTIPESTMIIEYLSRHYPDTQLLGANAEAAHEIRGLDRFYDLYVHQMMQKIVDDRLRPADAKDPHGVAQARATMNTAYGLLEAQMSTRTWAAGDTFSMADCAAAPPLFYGQKVQPFQATHPHLAAYFERLSQRPSYARVLKEAEPYLQFFPA